MEIISKNSKSPFDSKRSKIYNILTCLKFFKDRNIQGDDLQILAQGITFESMDAGETVFKAGTLGEKFYIILKGSVKILIPIKDKTSNEKRKSLFDQTEINNRSNKFGKSNTMKEPGK